jgi:adenosylmethionine-8-amino-7-oxononanoate aminotransferase
MIRSTIWHPFTQHAIAGPMVPVAAAQGAYLTTADGRRLIDAISSWWVITHGHCHPRITAAIAQQASQLDQVIFAGFTHAAAEEVAEGLMALAPTDLAHVFFSDSGSTAVEVAIKMAVGYWRHTGRPRSRIVVMEHGYHGDTVGAMSVGERGVFNDTYRDLLFEVTRIPFPVAGQETLTIAALEAAFNAEPVAALLIEPLILGAGGMLTYPPEVLAQLAQVCRMHGVLLILDEIMTGFGRTGTVFACEQAAVSPDIMCVAKGLTGGAIPLAATLCTAAIYDAHYAQDRTRTLFHSSSYTGNAIACAAAAANLAIWREEPVRARIAAVAEAQAAQLARLAGHRLVRGARRCGTIAAFDVAGADAGYLAGIGPRLMAGALARGVLLRPLGNTLYVMPPYCVSEDDLAKVYDVVAELLDETP